MDTGNDFVPEQICSNYSIWKAVIFPHESHNNTMIFGLYSRHRYTQISKNRKMFLYSDQASQQLHVDVSLLQCVCMGYSAERMNRSKFDFTH